MGFELYVGRHKRIAVDRRLAAIDVVGGYTGVTAQHRYVV